MSGNTYQLLSRREYMPGEYFYVNGPYDTHGIVVKSKKLKDRKETSFLNTIRGTGHSRRD